MYVSPKNAIVISNAVRRFGTATAVDDVSLNVERGEIHAIVGPDGAGKTTLLRLICGALTLHGGSITVDGVDVARNPAQVQAAIGYMPQRFSLYLDLSVMENLRFYGDIFGVRQAELTARMKELLDDFALSAFTQRRADELSGGMKQKLALACALIHSPATVLLDEPTAGVDPLSRRAFWQILEQIHRRGTTILVSTPYMDEAERAQHVAFMANGRILSSGTPEDLKRALSGEVIEVVCGRRGDARRALRGVSLARSIEVFGGALHVLVRSANEAIPVLQHALGRAGIADAQMRAIPATLEDAIVARLVS